MRRGEAKQVVLAAAGGDTARARAAWAMVEDEQGVPLEQKAVISEADIDAAILGLAFLLDS